MGAADDGLDIFPEVDGAEVLQRNPIFSRLSFDEASQLAAIMHVERFPKGKLVIEQDSLGQALYIVREGQVAIYQRDLKGSRDLLNRLGPGELFGEMSLLDDLLVSADVEVATDSAELVVIPRPDFEQLLVGNDRLATKIYKCFCRTLSDRLRTTNIRFVALEQQLRQRA